MNGLNYEDYEESRPSQASTDSNAAEYAAARKLGERAYRKAASAGQYPYLPALEEFFPDGSSDIGVPLGVMEIPLAQVVGTKTRGRQVAFACNFMPLLEESSEFARKWKGVYEAQSTEGIRDAVKVYEYMWNFYVLEGNKRVSVLKYVGLPEILADVIRVMPRGEEKETRVYLEFDRFFRVAPIYDLVFSEEGCYERLAEFLGENLEEPWPEDKVKSLSAAFTLFTEVYRAKTAEKKKLTAAEAFLVYLSFYHEEDPFALSKELIGKRIDKLRTEFRLRASEQPVSFQENPNLKESSSPLAIFLKPQLYTAKKPLKAAFLYETSPETSGWFYGHELGRNQLEQSFPGIVKTKAYSNCKTETEIRAAIDDAVEQGAELIFTTAPVQMEETMRAAVHFPNVRFMNCSINLSHGEVRSYYGRMHEAKFLMGVLAASLAENHKIGYVADYPINGAISRVNAFAIGAGMVDPTVEVYLTWTSLKDGDFKQYMTERGVAMISGPDLIKPAEASRDYGLYRISANGSVRNLAMPVWDWGKYYELIVRSILSGNYDKEDAPKPGQSLNYWWGMSAGVIDVILSKNLPYYTGKMIDIYRKALINETFRPFDGELRSRDGVVKKAGDPPLTNEEIGRMNWLNDNVIGEIPSPEELTEAGKNAVRISGLTLPKEEGV